MNQIDRMLGNLVKEVELYGRSGGDSIFLSNISLVVQPKGYEHPSEADIEGAYIDFNWFLLCSNTGIEEPHPDPDKSFWLRTWGSKAQPYGATWNFEALCTNLNSHHGGRRAILFNPHSSENPPCILAYQFQQEEFGRLDVTITMRSSDVHSVLPQDIMMTRLLLEHVCHLTEMEPGEMTFNFGNAHVYWEDCQWQEDYTIDDGL